MKRKNPLARLLRLRRIAQDRAAGELALSARRERQAHAHSQRAEEHVLGTNLEGEHAGEVWRSLVASRLASQSLMSGAVAAHAAAVADVGEATGRYNDAHRDTSILEKLEDKAARRARYEQAAAEANELDEIAAQQFRQKGDPDEH